MKESIIVLFFFSVGVLGGRLDLLPAGWLGLVHEASNLAVYAMLAAVGMSLGFDSRHGASCGISRAGSCSCP